jgi:16S rRNA processing protein RimM
VVKIQKTGYVKSPFGLKGELRVSFTRRYEPSAGELLHFEKDAKSSGPYSLLTIRRHGKDWVIKISGCSDADRAGTFAGQAICSQDPKLDENTYWVDDLIGCRVFTKDGRLVGSITDVLFTGGNDVYSVSSAEGKEILIPSVKSVVSSIDTGNKKVVINPIKGLLEEK